MIYVRNLLDLEGMMFVIILLGAFTIKKGILTDKGRGELTLKELSTRLERAGEDKEQLIPTVEIFKEIMVELIKNREIDIEALKRERSEYIQDRPGEFQLNEMLLYLVEEYPENSDIKRIEVNRIEDGSTVSFDGILNEDGIRKSIRCSNVSVRVKRKE